MTTAPEDAPSVPAEDVSALTQAVALDLFTVLSDTLVLMSDALQMTVALANGERPDPVTLGYALAQQRAGLAVVTDTLAKLAPLAGIDEGFDRAETARVRAEAVAARDRFLSEIRAAARPLDA